MDNVDPDLVNLLDTQADQSDVTNVHLRSTQEDTRIRPPDLWDSVVEPSSGFRLRRRSSTRVAAWCRDR